MLNDIIYENKISKDFLNMNKEMYLNIDTRFKKCFEHGRNVNCIKETAFLLNKEYTYNNFIKVNKNFSKCFDYKLNKNNKCINDLVGIHD